MVDAGELQTLDVATIEPERMPPVLAESDTPAVRKRIERFFLSIEKALELWVNRCDSVHTRRAYEQDVMAFIKHLNIAWPNEAVGLLAVSVAQVLEWRDQLRQGQAAPKTINRRISSVSSFYKFLQAIAAEMRLPIVVPNPAHSQFISRASTDPIDETKSLSATKARQLMGLPQGNGIIACRDRAILKFFLYSGARIGTACRLNVGDFHQDGEDATIRISEKGEKRRTIGLHFAAAESISEYLQLANISRGTLFRPRSGPRSQTLANRQMTTTAMNQLVGRYLKQLPGSVLDGRCIYTAHSLRATTATLLLDAGVDISKVQELLGHRHITTTQIYDKRRRGSSDSASHDVPI